MDIEAKYDRGGPASSINLANAEVLLAPFLRSKRIEFLELLSGGYLNSNYKIVVSGDPFVLRISNRPRGALNVEVAILRNLNENIPAPRSIFFDDQETAEGRVQFAVFSYLPGTPLYLAEDEFTSGDTERVGLELGRLLAAVHRVEFPASGDFDADFKVQHGLKDFVPAIRHETARCLNSEKLKSRLSPSEQEEVALFNEANAFLLNSLVQARLTHSDFNQKNILVDKVAGKWTVTGIIDWEYAFSGPCLYDLGNFLRFEKEIPFFRNCLAESYRQAGGTLPENWRKISRYLDILPQLQFLARDVETPKTFETAKAVIRDTIDTWNVD
jgi:fructokinase